MRQQVESDAAPETLRACAFLSTRLCAGQEAFVLCAGREQEVWDDALAQAIDALMERSAVYDEDTPAEYSFAHTIPASQNAWERYREAQCHLVMKSMLGGSGEGPEAARCWIEATVERLIDLHEVDL